MIEDSSKPSTFDQEARRNMKNQHFEALIRGRRPLIGGVLIAALGAAIAVPLMAGADDASIPENVQTLAPTLARVSLFDRQAKTTDQPDSRLEALRERPAARRTSATLGNPDATLRVPRSDADHSLAFVNDDDGTCILIADKAGSSASCGPGLTKVPAMGSADALDGGKWRVAFLLPDGVEQFNIHLRSGAVRAVPVRDNVVDEVVGDGGPTGFDWLGIDGAPQRLGSTVADEAALSKDTRAGVRGNE